MIVLYCVKSRLSQEIESEESSLKIKSIQHCFDQLINHFYTSGENLPAFKHLWLFQHRDSLSIDILLSPSHDHHQPLPICQLFLILLFKTLITSVNNFQSPGSLLAPSVPPFPTSWETLQETAARLLFMAVRYPHILISSYSHILISSSPHILMLPSQSTRSECGAWVVTMGRTLLM